MHNLSDRVPWASPKTTPGIVVVPTMTLERIGLLAGLLADLRHFKRSARLLSPASGEPVLVVEAPMSGRWFPVTVTQDARSWVFSWCDCFQVADGSALAAARIAEVVR